MSRRLRGTVYGMLASLALAACSTEPLAGRTASVVFLTDANCDYFVVQALRGSFAVLEGADDLVVRQGDVFEGGALRPGRVTFRHLPFGTDDDREDAPIVILDVEAGGLDVVEAQTRWRTLCAADG